MNDDTTNKTKKKPEKGMPFGKRITTPPASVADDINNQDSARINDSNIDNKLPDSNVESKDTGGPENEPQADESSTSNVEENQPVTTFATIPPATIEGGEALKHMFIIRGANGCGKTSLASLLKVLFESTGKRVSHSNIYDMFRDEGGQIEPQALRKRLAAARKYCKDKAKNLLKEGYDVVIVDDSMPKGKMVSDLQHAAERLGYRVTSIVLENRHDGEPSYPMTRDALLRISKEMELKLTS